MYPDDPDAQKAMANSGFNKAKHIIAGIGGGISGFGTGAKTTFTAKDNIPSSVASAMTKRNAKVQAAGASGGTFLGGVGSSARQFFTGETPYDRLERQISADENAIKMDEAALQTRKAAFGHYKNFMDEIKAEVDGNDKTVGNVDLNSILFWLFFEKCLMDNILLNEGFFSLDKTLSL